MVYRNCRKPVHVGMVKIPLYVCAEPRAFRQLLLLPCLPDPREEPDLPPALLADPCVRAHRGEYSFNGGC